jgi:hypothetical protein
VKERLIQWNDFFSGTLGGDVTRYIEFPFPVAFYKGKAWATNDSSATLALSGATSFSIAAQAVGDSADPATITPASTDVVQAAANELITVTLDYDGSSGTAGENVGVILWFLSGEV